jgi:phosphoribosylanthranilate isomerase
MTLVKICGLTRAEDVALACALGARYVGFNFAAGSPRRVAAEAARALSAATIPGVLKVGVFREEDADSVARAVEAGGLDLVQLHRRLTEEDIRGSPVPLIAVAPASGLPAVDFPETVWVRCHAVLLDSSEGSGRPVDPSLLSAQRWPVPVFVAGGLTGESVGAVIRRVRPAGVDVASGGESAPGIKDRSRLERLFAAVREADREAH